MKNHRRLLSESEEYRRNRSAIEDHARRHYESGGARFTGVVRIPVVVHVIYKTAAQNLSNAQIPSQIDVLNRDFRATNPDVSTVPAVFQPLVADCRVEFYLATTDANGNPTDGITRTATTVTSFAAATDAGVIVPTAFGTTGTATPPFHLGRTATHEIGHWLNLYHIWGDDGSGCNGSDEVADTPNQGSENYGTPAFPHVSCGNGPNGDLFMDYMDYVDDVAMVMFTHGQAARMEACLDGVRNQFVLQSGSATPEPAGPVVSWGSGRIDAFVVGTDRAMYHKWFDASSGWGPSVTGYEYMGGICSSPATAVAWGKDRLDVFVLGTDSALYHKWWDGSAWGPSVVDYEYMGGVCASPPTLVSWGTGRLDVFVIGTDSALYHKWYDASSGWGPSVTGWEYMGGVCADAPRVISWGPDRLDVFVVGTDSALYHKWWDGSAWGPSVTGYEYMGGVISDFRISEVPESPAALMTTPTPAARTPAATS